MTRLFTSSIGAAAVAALFGAGTLAPPAAWAQDGRFALNGGGAAAGSFAAEVAGGASGSVDLRSTALARGRYAVVIDLDENRLFFRKGELTLWSAPIGTGSGLRLQAGENEWDFSTPRGVFHVQFKERDPVWNAPDWYFVENGLPVPPPNDKSRKFPGGLGAAAVFIGRDLAIHGTDKPDLLGQRVSHGCIRLANKDAMRLFHNVQVGTEVIIVGGEDLEVKEVTPEEMQAKKNFNPKPKPAPKDPVLEGWKALATEDLLVVLGNELWLDAQSSRWTEVAGLLLERATKDRDRLALEGLLAGAGDLPSARMEREYDTYLADAFARTPLLTLEALAELDPQRRRRAAESLVYATMELYNGDFDERGAPWPTLRVPDSMVEDDAAPGWRAVAAAEEDFRRLRREAEE